MKKILNILFIMRFHFHALDRGLYLQTVDSPITQR